MKIKQLLYQQVLWRGLSIVMVFILNVLFARFYAASGSGSVFYLFTVFAFVIQGLSYSLESGVAYYAARNEIADGKLLAFSLAWSAIATAITAIFFVPVAMLFYGSLNYPLSYPVCYILGNMLISFGNAFCYSKYRFILPSLVSIAVNIMLILVLIGGNYSSGNIPFDFISIYFYSFLLHGIILFITLLLKYHSIKLSFHLSREQIKKIFHYSSYAFIANVLFLFISRVDYLFVKRYCSPADLGNYIQVSKIAQMFFILPSMVSTVIFPVIAGGFKGSMQSRIRKVSKILLLGYSFCCLVLAITGKWLFPALYGQSFISMYVPFLLLIPGILAISGLYPYTAYNSGNNRISINIKGSVLALALIIIGDILFIPPYGIKAAALISSAGYCVYHFYVVSVFKKESVSS